jgi:hypothetical protein
MFPQKEKAPASEDARGEYGLKSVVQTSLCSSDLV